ncbi:uncharacterized protein LOC144454555 [Phascolarctos cinereus]
MVSGGPGPAARGARWSAWGPEAAALGSGLWARARAADVGPARPALLPDTRRASHPPRPTPTRPLTPPSAAAAAAAAAARSRPRSGGAARACALPYAAGVGVGAANSRAPLLRACVAAYASAHAQPSLSLPSSPLHLHLLRPCAGLPLLAPPFAPLHRAPPLVEPADSALERKVGAVLLGNGAAQLTVKSLNNESPKGLFICLERARGRGELDSPSSRASGRIPPPTLPAWGTLGKSITSFDRQFPHL